MRTTLLLSIVLSVVLAISGAGVECWGADANDDAFRPPAITTTGVPVLPVELVEKLRQYQEVRSAEFRGWAPDGRGMLIQTRFGNTSQLHRVYEPGGRREQLTFFAEPADGRFLPHDEHGSLLITLSRGGDENTQILVMDGQSGEIQRLTDGKSRNLLGPVRDDGLFLIVSNNSRNGRDTDLYIADPREPGSLSRLLQTDGEFWEPMDWSPDGDRVLIKHYVSINESYPALLDLRPQTESTKTAFSLPTEGIASYGAMAFAADGQSVFLATDARGEFLQLAKLDLKTRKHSLLTKDIPWNVSEIEVAPPSQLLPHDGLVAFTVNEDGASALYLLMNETSRRIEMPLSIIESLEFSPDGTQLGFTLSRPDAPSDAYSLNLVDGKLIRWTFSEVGGLDASNFITPQRIKFRTFDGRMIPAYYFKPRGAAAETPAAVLINIHGGPESQYQPYFRGIDQFYLNELGIAIVWPNVRGSDGYGKSYLLLDNAEKREDSVRDIGALLDWVAEQPELDAARVAVEGGSYGGYMVLASLVHFSERIRAGVDIVGIASFASFLKNTSAYRRDLRRAEYGDERNPKLAAFFHKIDPLNNAEKIRCSLLVAHGRNDPRVPFSEAEQIAPKVRANGQTVWTVYADNEGHGFAKKANRDYVTAAIALFLREHLGGTR